MKEKNQKNENIYNIPNFITLFRLFLTIPVVILILNNLIIPAGIFFIFFCALDLLDGFIARSMNQETYFGKHFDFGADVTFGISIFVVLLLVGYIPISLGILTGIAYLLISLLAIASILRGKEFQLSKNDRIGPITTFSLIFMFFIAMYNTFTLIIISLLLGTLYFIVFDYIWKEYVKPACE